MKPIFHLCSTPASTPAFAALVPFATPDFAATMLNLIRGRSQRNRRVVTIVFFDGAVLPSIFTEIDFMAMSD